MAFGIYVHIPYCLQICPYCDFTKYEAGKIMPPQSYVNLLIQEIRGRAGKVPAQNREVNTLYFGGGTPSLFEPSLILAIKDELAKAGFRWAEGAEFSIEIDPATVDESRLQSYLDIGINRFSVGAQTFNSRLLKIAGRKHTSEDTVELLSLLKRRNVNYSFDLLFGLPTQTLEELRADLATALMFNPSHLSAYCLTVPESHPMAKNRAPEEEQVEMFDLIERELATAGVLRYEISNFARPGFESRHNLLYWTDQPYWGLGTSAHSYFPEAGDWGLRFWNAPSLIAYEKEVRAQTVDWDFGASLPEPQREALERHQALTDFCHTSLRLVRGLSENALRLKFGDAVTAQVVKICRELTTEGTLAHVAPEGWSLTEKGRVLSNQVFERFTFLRDELTSSQANP